MRIDSFQDEVDAPVTPSPSPGRFHPDWLKKPTGDDVAWAYPDHAARLGLSGRAKIQCSVMADGKLAKCRVLTESPAGENFGAAALALAPQFQMTPPPPGVATPPQVTIPLTFQAPPSGTVLPDQRPLEPRTPPLTGLASQAGDWLAHHARSPPLPWLVGAGLALALIVGGVMLNRWSRQASGRDLTGPNSERR